MINQFALLKEISFCLIIKSRQKTRKLILKTIKESNCWFWDWIPVGEAEWFTSPFVQPQSRASTREHFKAVTPAKHSASRTRHFSQFLEQSGNLLHHVMPPCYELNSNNCIRFFCKIYTLSAFPSCHSDHLQTNHRTSLAIITCL